MIRGRFFKYAALAVAFVGLFVEICLLAEISGRSKEISSIEADIRLTHADIDNIELALAQQTKLSIVGERAEKLGMRQPSDEQIRLISLPSEYAADYSHTAEIAGAQ